MDVLEVNKLIYKCSRSSANSFLKLPLNAIGWSSFFRTDTLKSHVQLGHMSHKCFPPLRRRGFACWPPKGCLHWPCIWAPPPGAEWTNCCPKPWWDIMPVMWDTPPCCKDKRDRGDTFTTGPFTLERFAEGKSYRLLLAEEKTAELRIGSWVWQAEYGTLSLGLPTLCDLVGWSSADGRLLIGWPGCSHRHLKRSLRCCKFKKIMTWKIRKHPSDLSNPLVENVVGCCRGISKHFVFSQSNFFMLKALLVYVFIGMQIIHDVCYKRKDSTEVKTCRQELNRPEPWDVLKRFYTSKNTGFQWTKNGIKFNIT